MVITSQQFADFVGDAHRAALFFPFINIYLPKYHITDTPTRVQMFMAQAGHESIGFSALVESTNYSHVDTVLRIFKRHFKDAKDAKKYINNPVAFANRVYANRMGNGSEASGDGYKHRGRGVFQLTGKTMYELFGAQACGDKNKFTDHPELLATPEYAVLSACWFWNLKDLSSFADKYDKPGVDEKGNPIDPMHYFQAQTVKVNGGLNGYDSRVEWFHKAQKFFN